MMMTTPPRVLAVGGPPFRHEVAEALDLPAEIVHWVPSVGAAEKQLVESGNIAMMVISPEMDERDCLHIAEFTNKTSPVTAVVVVRHTSPNGLLPAFVRAGVRDVVDVSAGQDDLRDALGRAMKWAQSLRGTTPEVDTNEKLGKIITVFSSKGGTGKTFVSTSLALAISRHIKADVALIDLDFGMGDVFSYFGSEPKRPLEDLNSPNAVISQETLHRVGTQLDEHLWAYGNPADPTLEGVPAEGVSKIIRAMQMHFEVVVIDGPAEYSDQVLAAFDASDMVCIVAGLDVVGVRHLAKAMETLSSIGIAKNRMRVIVNRADSKVGLSVADVEKVTGIKVNGGIPSSRLVPTALNKGTPVLLDEPGSEVSKSINQIAQQITASLLKRPAAVAGDESHKKRRLFSRTR